MAVSVQRLTLLLHSARSNWSLAGSDRLERFAGGSKRFRTLMAIPRGAGWLRKLGDHYFDGIAAQGDQPPGTAGSVVIVPSTFIRAEPVPSLVQGRSRSNSWRLETSGAVENWFAR